MNDFKKAEKEAQEHLKTLIAEGKEKVSYAHMYQLAKIQIFQSHGIVELMARDSFDRMETLEDEIQNQKERIKRRMEW